MTIRDHSLSGQRQSPELTTSGRIYAGIHNASLVLRFVGDVRLVWCVALEEYCSSVFANEEVTGFYVDLSVAANLDSTTLGVLAKLGILAKKQLSEGPRMYYATSDIKRLVECMGFSKVFDILTSEKALDINDSELHALDSQDCGEDVMRDSVISAHKTLIGLSDENKKKFQNLVDTLEKK